MHKKHMFLRVFQKIALFACVFCAFFISPVFATLPAGYTPLEYIGTTSDGAYINTGLNYKSKYTYEVKWFKTAEENVICGARLGGYSDKGHWSINYSTGSLVYCSSQNASIASKIEGPLNQYNVTKFNQINRICVSNGYSAWDSRWLNDYDVDYPVFLFKINSSGTPVGNRQGEIRICYYKVLNENNVEIQHLIPAKRNSDSVLGMYDTVSGTFFTNQGTGDFIAGPEVVIKIATTKMVDEEFAAAEAKLATTVQTIESVVSRTITQTGQIQVLQDTKQTRPDESCPANMKCLLVQDEDGTPHWYPIVEP